MAIAPCPFCGCDVAETTSRHFAGAIFCNNCQAQAPKEMWNLRSAARTDAGYGAGFEAALNAATVSCSGTDITIQCADHDVKDAIFNGLESIAALPAPATATASAGESVTVEEFGLALRLVMPNTLPDDFFDRGSPTRNRIANDMARRLMSEHTITRKSKNEERS